MTDEIILTRLEQQVLRAIDAFGGMATAEALAVVLGKYRTHISHTLKALEAKEKLRGVEAQLVPGRDTGRPMRIYIRAGKQISSVWEKIKGLIRSRMVTEMAAVGYRFLSYDDSKEEMEFKDLTCSGRSMLIIVVDDPHQPVERLVERITAVRARRQLPIAAVQSAERAAKLCNILTGRIEPIIVCDVVKGRGSEFRMAFDEYQKAISPVHSSDLASGKW